MGQATKSLQKTWVSIPVADHPMEAYRVAPEGKGPWPAVIVLMEIFGVNEHIRDVTERIAGEGYVAIAPNYYHRTTQNLELDYSEDSIAEGRRHKDQTTRENILVDLRAIIQGLQEDPAVLPKDKIGCVGFCFGGHVAYIAAGMKEIAATASFYAAGVAVMSPGGGNQPSRIRRKSRGKSSACSEKRTPPFRMSKRLPWKGRCKMPAFRMKPCAIHKPDMVFSATGGTLITRPPPKTPGTA